MSSTCCAVARVSLTDKIEKRRRFLASAINTVHTHCILLHQPKIKFITLAQIIQLSCGVIRFLYKYYNILYENVNSKLNKIHKNMRLFCIKIAGGKTIFGQIAQRYSQIFLGSYFSSCIRKVDKTTCFYGFRMVLCVKFWVLPDAQTSLGNPNQ